jgi:two-component system nitrate/nitrite response regulator NarL
MRKIKLLLAVKSGFYDQKVLETLQNEKEIEIVGNTRSMREAKIMSRKYEPDILLLDINNINGDYNINYMGTFNPDIRFIAVSDKSENNREELFASIAAGAHGYILRNISYEELLNDIKLVYEGGCVLNPELMPVFVDGYKQLENGRAGKADLSYNERQVMTFIIRGMNERVIARRLGTSRRMIKKILRNIMRRLEAKNILHAVTILLKKKLVDSG